MHGFEQNVKSACSWPEIMEQKNHIDFLIVIFRVLGGVNRSHGLTTSIGSVVFIFAYDVLHVYDTIMSTSYLKYVFYVHLANFGHDP